MPHFKEGGSTLRNHSKLILPILLIVTLACSSQSLIDPTPTPAPTLTSTPRTGEQTACNHPYLPLRPGAYWEYEVLHECPSEGKFTTCSVTEKTFRYSSQVSSIQGDVYSATAKLKSVYTRRCDAAGIHHQDSGLNYWLYLPSAENLVLGHSWEGSNELYYAFGTLETTYVVTGVEPVTFQGQRYEAIQVTKTILFTTQQRRMATGHLSPASDGEITCVLTFGHGIGLVQESCESHMCVYNSKVYDGSGRGCEPSECPECMQTKGWLYSHTLTDFGVR